MLTAFSRFAILSVLASATAVTFSGCGDSGGTSSTGPDGGGDSSASATDDHGHSHDEDGGHGGHSHGAGPHCGTLADWGGGKYHVEFTVDHDRREAVVYVLGSDEKTPVPIAAGSVLLSINSPAFQVELQPSPLEGETAEMSSRFSGTHENLGKVQEFAGTISAEVDGTPYAAEFAEEAHGAGGHSHDHGGDGE